MQDKQMLKLLIARHGNTFEKGDTILRVGRRTDLPLSTSGKIQSQKLGDFLTKNYPQINAVYCSNLLRTQQTAQIATDRLKQQPKLQVTDFLDEIDYGPDDGKPESDVIRRIGKNAIKLWEEKSIVPHGWIVKPGAITDAWKDFTKQLAQNAKESKIVLVVTSNGIARFAPNICENSKLFFEQNSAKMATGSISEFSFTDNRWQINFWNKCLN